MLRMLSDIFKKFKKEMIVIILLSIMESMLAGLNILILIPILNLLEIGGGSDLGIFSFTITIFDGIPYIAKLAIILSAYILLMLAKALLNRFTKIYNAKFIQKNIKALRSKVYEIVIDSDWELFSAQKHDDLLNSFTSEITKTSKAITSFTSLISIILTSITQITIAIAINIPLTIIIIFIGSILFFVLRKFFNIAKENAERMRIANKAYLREIRGQLNSIQEIKSYGVEASHKELFDEVLSEYEEANIKKTEMASIPSLIYSISSTVLISVLIYMANIVLKIEMLNLILIVYIFARIWPIFNKFHGQIQTLVSSLPSFENLEKLLSDLHNNTEKEDYDETTITLKEGIKFNNVTFSYLNSNDIVLDNTSFYIKANSITAIRGKSGVGKSTIVNLLMGLLEPVKGEILIDNILLNKSNIRSWRKSIGYMPQDPIVLNRSIEENIRRFNPGISDEDILVALEKAQALEFVEKLPEGLNTLMGNKGIRLSGGEKQRIVLARVLSRRPSILILDEATSALDKENEKSIQEIIKSLKEDITVIVISHRESSVDNAEYVIDVNEIIS